MKITEVKLRIPEKKYLRLRAIASITIDNELIINDIRLISEGSKYFIDFPRSAYAQMAQLQTIAPLSYQTREKFLDAILKKYKEQIQKVKKKKKGGTICPTLFV